MLAQETLGLKPDVELAPYSIDRFATGSLLVGKYGPELCPDESVRRRPAARRCCLMRRSQKMIDFDLQAQLPPIGKLAADWTLEDRCSIASHLYNGIYYAVTMALIREVATTGRTKFMPSC